ncbi:helix-turn-helix transcriptional regulator [Eubacteriales bacterium OttesenSCG-928-A19]|nr:helix-turn-helix transcriptional regulator [Eubacteriales bacterium OttesenSCG-928-A19]
MTILQCNEPMATNISRIITERGVKHAYIARKAGYSSQEFSNMLKGRRIIKVADIERLATALDVSLNDLFGIDPKSRSA